LRNFSRLDEAEIKLANINAGLDSTIILLQGNINGRIKINKAYGNIPEVECYAGKLNQVFMNILTNGIQAIQAKGLPPGEGSITVQTRHTEKDLIISFIDNGIGMSEEGKKQNIRSFFHHQRCRRRYWLGYVDSLQYHTDARRQYFGRFNGRGRYADYAYHSQDLRGG
jgi:signal transduction histidine kinase